MNQHSHPEATAIRANAAPASPPGAGAFPLWARHGGWGTLEYDAWKKMRRRCENKHDKSYSRYGGRGITVCPEWSQSFAAFRDYMGPRPAGMSIDRIDNSRGYEPGNVRWATRKEQGRNCRTSLYWHIRGQVFETAGEAASALGVGRETVRRWVYGRTDGYGCRPTPPRADCYVVAKYT